MLYWENSSGKLVAKVAHKKDFKRWRKGLTDDQYQAIVAAINRRIDGKKEVVAGKFCVECMGDATFQPVGDVCGDKARLFIGLLLMEAMMNREENWCAGPSVQNKGKHYRRYEPPQPPPVKAETETADAAGA